MGKKDIDAIMREAELSPDKKDAIAYLAKLAKPYQTPADWEDAYANGNKARLKTDPSESQIRNSVDAEIQSRKPTSDHKEFEGHAKLSESLAQIIARNVAKTGYDDAKQTEQLTTKLAALITGAHVVYTDNDYTRHEVTVTQYNAMTVAEHKIDQLRDGTVTMDKKGEFHQPPLYGGPPLEQLISSAIDADISAHLASAPNTPVPSQSKPPSVSKIRR